MEGTEPQAHAVTSPRVARFLNHPHLRAVFSERVPYWLLLLLAFLLPIFFIPGGAVALEFSKIVLLELVVLVAMLIWALHALKEGNIEVPKSVLLAVGFLLVLQFIASAFASPAPLVSFFGSGYDMGTVSSFIVLFLVMFLSSLVFVTSERVLMFYAALLFSGVLAMCYHLLRHVFGADVLDFGMFKAVSDSPVGRWNDFASLVGALSLLALVTLYFFPQNKLLRYPLWAVLVAGFFFLLVIDFTILWYILFILSGALILFAVYEGEIAHKKHRAEGGAHRPLHRRVAGHLPVFATILFVAAFIYASGISTMPWGKHGTTIAGVVNNILRATPYSEVVLTPGLTADIVKNAYEKSLFFGFGPNRFGPGYLEARPTDLLRTPFWDTTFEQGIGRIPTYFGTTGLLGTVLWLFFIVFLFAKGRKIFTVIARDRVAGYIAFSLFILAVYFWSIAFFYVPGTAIYTLAFLTTGALIAFLAAEGVLKRILIDFRGDSRLSVVFTPFVIVVVIGMLASGILLFRQTASLVAFRDAQQALAVGNAERAEEELLAAARYFERDVYYRGLSNVALVKLERLAKETSSSDVAERANRYIADARSYAERAVAIDPTNAENYLQLGGVYDALGILGVQNTASFAREQYEKALALNPRSPRILFLMARIALSEENNNAAKEYLRKALAERPNFMEGVAFLVQLEIADRNTGEAIRILEQAVAAEPGNFLLRFALGYLYYSEGKYGDATRELEAAVMLNPVYADAKYFLALSYERQKRRADAIAQLSDVATLNPDNKDVAQILRNLRAGRSPFDAGYTPPSDAVEDALNGLRNSRE